MEKVEFIESYIKDGNDYIWNDNHGELIRCKDCVHSEHLPTLNVYKCDLFKKKPFPADWYCAGGRKKW